MVASRLQDARTSAYRESRYKRFGLPFAWVHRFAGWTPIADSGNDAVGEGEFVAASGGLLIMQGAGAVAGPLLAGLAMSASERGLSYTLIATQILMAAFGVYRLTRRAAPPEMHKGIFVIEPLIPVGTTLESAHSRAD